MEHFSFMEPLSKCTRGNPPCGILRLRRNAAVLISCYIKKEKPQQAFACAAPLLRTTISAFAVCSKHEPSYARAAVIIAIE